MNPKDHGHTTWKGLFNEIRADEEARKLEDKTKQLVAQYTANGTAGMSQGEVQLLLSQKQLHLAEVSQRCAEGQGVLVNVVLKRALEGQVTEIGKSYQQLLQEHARAGKEPEQGIER